MSSSTIRIIQALALTAAILGLLLCTPSLEAKTAHAKKHKMKIVFDGSAPSEPQGELGDEIVQPQASSRNLSEPSGVVHLRGSSVDDIWKKNARNTKARSQKADDNPDLIETSTVTEAQTPASRISKSSRALPPTDPSVDESALAKFKTSSNKLRSKTERASAKKLAQTEQYASDARTRKEVRAPIALAKHQPKTETIQPLPEPIMEFDETKPTAQAITRPKSHSPPSRIYLRNVQPVIASHSLSTSLAPSEPSAFKFNFALENTTSLGRTYELETPGGRNYLMKNEALIGAEHSTGWGAKISVDYLTTSNADSTKDTREMGDPSLIIMHPMLYKDRDVTVSGYIRYFLPVSNESKSVSLQHFAYSLIADLKLIGHLDLQNDLTPHYYEQATYADTDAFSTIYDATELSHVFDWFRLGLGQRTQIESHQAIAPGTTVEIYPLVEFRGVQNFALEAKMYLPVLVNGVVNGIPGSSAGPSNAGLSNAQAEFSARLGW